MSGLKGWLKAKALRIHQILSVRVATLKGTGLQEWIHCAQNPAQQKAGPKTTGQSNTGMLTLVLNPRLTHACTSRATRAPSRGFQTSDAARCSVSSPAAHRCDSTASNPSVCLHAACVTTCLCLASQTALYLLSDLPGHVRAFPLLYLYFQQWVALPRL